MNGSVPNRLRHSGTRYFLGGRRPPPRVILHPLSCSVNASQQQYFFSLYPLLCKRSIQNQPTSQSNEANKVRHQNQSLHDHPLRRHIISDPTAKRPTQKCDPYGLGGKSLSHTHCLDLISTLEDGWKLLFEPRENNNNDKTTTHYHHDGLSSDEATTTTTTASPTHLQKYYHHPTFYDASKFMTHIALLATNHNHFPILSIERILVENMNDFHPPDNHLGNEHDLEGGTMKRRIKKVVKGWIFRSTVRCSTYRPSSSLSNPHSCSAKVMGESKQFQERVINGLTYHDFHLAMSIDVEVNREDVKQWLWVSSSSSSSDANK